jgi:hypothetical protein
MFSFAQARLTKAWQINCHRSNFDPTRCSFTSQTKTKQGGYQEKYQSESNKYGGNFA